MSELGSYLAAPDPEAPLIICCRVGDRGKAPAALEKLVKPFGSVRKVDVARKDLPVWIAERAKSRGVNLTLPAARALTEVIGADPAQLVAGMEQVADAFPDQRIGPEQVRGQFRGLGEQKVWDLCDRAFGKDLAGAIRSLRAIEEGGDDPLMVLGGVASRLRDLIKVRALPERMSPGQLAREAGLRFDWQARRYRQQAGNFTMPALVSFQSKIAEADRALKSGAEGEVVMPVLIAAIAGD
jgi:DNA polymerase III subunit delta